MCRNGLNYIRYIFLIDFIIEVKLIDVNLIDKKFTWFKPNMKEISRIDNVSF